MATAEDEKDDTFDALASSRAPLSSEITGCNMGMNHTGGMQYCKNSIGNVGNGYSYQLWSSGQGSGCMTVFGADATFKSNWSGVQDFLARVGLGWDSSKSYDRSEPWA